MPGTSLISVLTLASLGISPANAWFSLAGGSQHSSASSLEGGVLLEALPTSTAGGAGGLSHSVLPSPAWQERQGGIGSRTRTIVLLCLVMYGPLSLGWLLYRYQLNHPSAWGIKLSAAGKEFAYVGLICMSWCAMSVGLNVMNKSLVSSLPSPAIISICQMAMALAIFTIAGMVSWPQQRPTDPKQVARWMVVPVLFAAMLCTSFYTLQYISLSLLTAVRNLSPLVAIPLEVMVMPREKRPKVTCCVVVNILLMLAGTLLYAGGLPNTSLVGIIFAFSNLVLAVSDRLLQRRFLTHECKDLSSGLCTILNNGVGLIPAAALALATHQVQHLVLPEQQVVWRDPCFLLLLILSGAIGSGICYLGLECQRAISATSFFVLQNVSKVGIIAAGVAFFGDPIRSPCAIAGLLLSLISSFAYGYIQMAIPNPETTTLLPKSTTRL